MFSCWGGGRLLLEGKGRLLLGEGCCCWGGGLLFGKFVVRERLLLGRVSFFCWRGNKMRGLLWKVVKIVFRKGRVGWWVGE